MSLMTLKFDFKVNELGLGVLVLVWGISFARVDTPADHPCLAHACIEHILHISKS